MFLKSSLLKPIAVAALFVAAGVSHAAITVFTTQASFAAATRSPGVDTFAGFSITGSTTSPINRSAGAYTYTAAVSTTSFFGAGTAADPWLSTNTATDSITFSTFSGGARAIGGNFFGSNIAGAFAAGNVTLVATDALGAVSTQTITNAMTTSFLGFVSTTTLTSLVLFAVQPASASDALWPTVDNLTLALAVPEPQGYALMLAGLGALGFIARHRRG